MFGIGRQSRTRQSRTSWAGIAAQPGGGGRAGGGLPMFGIGRQSRTRQSRTSWAGGCRTSWAAARLCRARRRDCRWESDGNHGLGNPEHPGRRLPNILGGGAAMPGAAAGMFGIGRQSRTRQSRTSWAGIRGGCRTSWAGGATRGCYAGRGGAAMPGAAAGLPMFGIGRQSRTRQSRTSWAGIAAQPGAAAAAADPGAESDGIGRQSRTRQSRTS